MKFGRNTAAIMPERTRGSGWGMKSGSPCSLGRLLSVRSGDHRRYVSAVLRRGGAGQPPVAEPAGYANGDLRLLKTLKTATVQPTPPAVWRLAIW